MPKKNQERLKVNGTHRVYDSCVSLLGEYIHSTYMRTYIHTYVHTYICTHIHTYIHAYIHTCIQTYIHTYIHAYVHIIKKNAECASYILYSIGKCIYNRVYVHFLYIECRENRNIKITSKHFENVLKFKYFAATLTYKNCTHREIKSRVNSENACDHSGQKLLYSRLLPKDVTITINIEHYLTFFLYGHETWFLISKLTKKLRLGERN